MLKEIATITFFVICLTPFAWYQYESWRTDRIEWLSDLINPLKESVQNFHESNGRYPTRNESIALIEKNKCLYDDQSDSNCTFKGENIETQISNSLEGDTAWYGISFTIMRTRCGIHKSDSPQLVTETHCGLAPIISLRQ